MKSMVLVGALLSSFCQVMAFDHLGSGEFWSLGGRVQPTASENYVVLTEPLNTWAWNFAESEPLPYFSSYAPGMLLFIR